MVFIGWPLGDGPIAGNGELLEEDSSESSISSSQSESTSSSSSSQSSHSESSISSSSQSGVSSSSNPVLPIYMPLLGAPGGFS